MICKMTLLLLSQNSGMTIGLLLLLLFIYFFELKVGLHLFTLVGELFLHRKGK